MSWYWGLQKKKAKTEITKNLAYGEKHKKQERKIQHEMKKKTTGTKLNGREDGNIGKERKKEWKKKLEGRKYEK